MLILMVFLSLIFGWATATECAAWGVAGALGARLVVRHAHLGDASARACMSATRLTCMIMLILAGAAFTTAAMAYTGIPAALAEPGSRAQHLSPYALDRWRSPSCTSSSAASSTASR